MTCCDICKGLQAAPDLRLQRVWRCMSKELDICYAVGGVALLLSVKRLATSESSTLGDYSPLFTLNTAWLCIKLIDIGRPDVDAENPRNCEVERKGCSTLCTSCAQCGCTVHHELLQFVPVAANNKARLIFGRPVGQISFLSYTTNLLSLS